MTSTRHKLDEVEAVDQSEVTPISRDDFELLPRPAVATNLKPSGTDLPALALFLQNVRANCRSNHLPPFLLRHVAAVGILIVGVVGRRPTCAGARARATQAKLTAAGMIADTGADDRDR